MGREKYKTDDPFDFGNIEFDEFDPKIFDMSSDLSIEGLNDRFIKPKAYNVKPHFILYENAEKLAKELTLNKNERFDAFVAGTFIFGDFIEAYIVHHNANCKKMTISTLSLSQENVDSLKNLMEGGFVEELDLIVSAYFFAYERRSLIPYIYKELDKEDRFQLTVVGTHTKTCTFETSGGKKIVIHGSANLRSSGNIEQFTIEENEELYDFYNEYYTKMIEEYKTINKPIRGEKLWNVITEKKFND